MSDFQNAPEFATKLRAISLTNDIISGKYVNINGIFGASPQGIDNGLGKSGVGLYIGTGNTNLTISLNGGTVINEANFVNLKNVPSGSFLALIAKRILVADVTYLKEGTTLHTTTTTVAQGTYSKLNTTTSGSGTGLKVDLLVTPPEVSGDNILTIKVKGAAADIGYASGDTITISASESSALSSDITFTLGAPNFSTLKGTDASDIVAYY